MKKHSLPLLLALPAAALLLGGCPALVASSGVAGGIVANDERTTGSFVEDQVIESKAEWRIDDALGSSVYVDVVSYNRHVLLVGQAPSAAAKKKAEEIVRKVENVRDVENRLEIANPSSLVSRAADAALTARVKTALCRLQAEGFSCLDVKVVTETGTVYILGLVSKKQAAIAVETARKISGVKRVAKVFEFL